MNIAFVGCGYVFDIYMRTRWAHPELNICGVFDINPERLQVVARHYALHAYPSYSSLLADKKVDAVINLTSVHSHFEAVRQALEAGKHVYTEKPVTTALSETRALFDLAAEKGLALTGAPCNLFSDAIATMWKAVRDGAIGKPILIYAELDDNPAHLMSLETVRSPTGAPFPVMEEFQVGCTLEHIGYHLVWMCAMFGPVVSVTAFSNTLVPYKTDASSGPIETPDFSVACLNFAHGVAARVTCTWVSPRDHRLRIIGDAGEISADNAFHDQARVHLERFSRVSLSARKAYTLRTHVLLGRLFGLGGHQVRLVRQWKSHAVEAERGVGRTWKHKLVSWLRRREVYAQDKLLGIAEMARALKAGRPQPMPPDFLIHINELMLMVQSAGPQGATAVPTTSFTAVAPLADFVAPAPDYLQNYRPTWTERTFTGLVAMLHNR